MIVCIRILLLTLFLGVSTSTHASIGAFWLGVNAKVETRVKVDQRVLETINNLPIKAREQAVLAANEVIEKLDQKVKEDIKLLSAEIERVSLSAALQWECTFKNVIDKLFSDLRDTLPRWNLFPDRCERQFIPDKIGPGPAEKVSIAECWIYEAMGVDNKPDIVATKLSNLELMSVDAACRLRETQSGPQMWKRSTDFGLRYSMWSTLGKSCANAKACFAQRAATIGSLVSSADSRDVGMAKERLSQSKLLASREGCNLRCYEEALVALFIAESEVARNRQLREGDAKALVGNGNIQLAASREAAAQARKAAESVRSLAQYKQLSVSARNVLELARQSSKSARATSSVVEAACVSLEREADAIDRLLVEADKVASATQAMEEKRQAKIAAARIQRQLDRNSWLDRRMPK